MSDNRKVAEALIVKAADTVLRDRPGVHGSAENSFAMIADLWTVYLSHTRKVRGSSRIIATDVAQMMGMLKKARAVYGAQDNPDNFVDDIGYSALAGMLQLPDFDNTPSPGPKTEPPLPDMASQLAEDLNDRVKTSTGIVHRHENIDGQGQSAGELLNRIYSQQLGTVAGEPKKES